MRISTVGAVVLIALAAAAVAAKRSGTSFFVGENNFVVVVDNFPN